MARSSKKIIFQFIIILGVQAIFVSSVSAATLSAQSNKERYAIGDVFAVDLNLDSQGEYVNALEIRILYDNKILELTGFGKGNSIVPFWITEPSPADRSGSLILAGGIPNGFEGKVGLLGTLIFRAVAPGEAEIKISPDSKILLNDGQGSPAKFLGIGRKIIINEKSANGQQNEWQADLNLDKISPESFRIYLNRSERLFGGQYFIAFSTNDKQTGVAYYEVKEGEGDWQKSNSPYLLKNQNRNEKIAVRAVDQAGNERVEILFPAENQVSNSIGKFWQFVLAPVAVILLICYFIIRQLRRKNNG